MTTLLAAGMKNMTAIPSAYTASALQILREPKGTMQWYLIPLFVLLIYIVSVEIKNKNWSVLCAGAALWGVDLFNEIWNALICFETGAPVWGTPAGLGGGDTALLILIGYNVEISIMFFLMGLAVGHTLQAIPKEKKLLGINNRIWVIIVMTTLAVLVEIFLNYCGILTWEKSWWQPDVPYILWLIGYLPFFVAAAAAHDLPKKGKGILLFSIFFIDILFLITYGSMGML